MLRPKRTQKRKIGIQASIVGVCWKPKKSVPIALLEDQHQQPVGRADREQVHQIALSGTTIERKASISRRKLRPSTKAKTIGV